MKVLTIGGAMYDIFIQQKQTEMISLKGTEGDESFIALEEGKKIEVDSVAYHIGGGAVNAAVSLQRLEFTVTSFFKVGADSSGDFILDDLKKKSVNTTLSIRTTTAATGTSFIIHSQSGNRAVLVYRGANLTLTKKELPLVQLSQYQQLYITSLSQESSHLLPIITSEAKKLSIPVAVNPGTSQLTTHVKTLEQALPFIDILILNTHEATMLMSALMQQDQHDRYTDISHADLPELLRAPIGAILKCFMVRQFFHEILRRGPQMVVVTNGAEGVYATEGNRLYFHPSIKSKVVSTLGAGDAFGSTFVAYCAKQKGFKQALLAGALNAASVLQYADTQTGLLTAEQLDQKIKEFKESLVQEFPL